MSLFLLQVPQATHNQISYPVSVSQSPGHLPHGQIDQQYVLCSDFSSFSSQDLLSGRKQYFKYCNDFPLTPLPVAESTICCNAWARKDQPIHQLRHNSGVQQLQRLQVSLMAFTQSRCLGKFYKELWQKKDKRKTSMYVDYSIYIKEN